jgi:hypothetical protein
MNEYIARIQNYTREPFMILEKDGQDLDHDHHERFYLELVDWSGHSPS